LFKSLSLLLRCVWPVRIESMMATDSRASCDDEVVVVVDEEAVAQKAVVGVDEISKMKDGESEGL
jgi:hypothetical protein